MSRRIAVVPTHGIGIRDTEPQAKNLAENLMRKLRHLGIEAEHIEVYPKAQSSEANGLCLTVKLLPDPIRTIITSAATIDVRPAKWGDVVHKKTAVEIAGWARQFTRQLPGQKRQTGIAKTAAENFTTLAIGTIFLSLFSTIGMILVQIINQPTFVASAEYILIATCIISGIECILTGLTEKIHPEHSPIVFQASRKRRRSRARLRTRFSLQQPWCCHQSAQHVEMASAHRRM